MKPIPDSEVPLEALGLMEREEAIPRLVEREGPRLHTLAKRFCGDADQAEDLVQEVFLQAFKSWDQFRGDSQVGTWLYRIAARTCMRMQRRRAGEPAHCESLEELLPTGESRFAAIPGPDEEPLSEELREEGRRSVQQAITGLPEDFRLPLVLKEMVGFSVAEIASILDMPEATVKTRLHRARLKLRRSLDSSLPTKEVPPFALDRAICMDLLTAKQNCLDRGQPFTFPEGKFCERCSEVFASLDFTQDLCHLEGKEDWPVGLGSRILGALRAQAG